MARSVTPAAKLPYHHGDLRAALQAAAADLLSRQSADSISLRQISQAAGVSHAAAYRHYTDKQALLADLAEAGFRRLAALNRRAIASTTEGPVAQLQACGRAYVRFGIRRPHLLQLMFGGSIVQWQSYPGLAQASAELAATLAQVVQSGQAQGELREGAAGDLALTAWSLVHGLAMLLAGQHVPGARVDAAFSRDASRRCVALLVEGLRPALTAPAEAAAGGGGQG